VLTSGDLSNGGIVTGGQGGQGGSGATDGGSGGAGGAGVTLLFGVPTLVNTGTVDGGAGGAGGAGPSPGVRGAQGDGVDAAFGGVIVNGGASAKTALIAGAVGVYAASGVGTTVTNFGTIEGTGGVAVQFGSSADRLIVEAGAVFDGRVVGGGGSLVLAAGTGTIHGLGFSFTGFGSCVVETGGAWALSGTTAVGAEITVAANAYLKVAAGGTLDLRGDVTSGGHLETFQNDLTVEGAVSGAGAVFIDGGLADFGSTFSQSVRFGTAGGTLELADSRAFGGTVSGFSTSGATAFDLRDIAFVSRSEATFSGTASGGVLTVSDGTHTARIALAGDYTGSTWTASSDGAGGVTVVDPAPRRTAQAFVSAMASVGGGGLALDAAPGMAAPGLGRVLAAPR